MRRFLLFVTFVGTSLLTLTISLGCSHHMQAQCDTCSMGPTPQTVVLHPMTAPPAAPAAPVSLPTLISAPPAAQPVVAPAAPSAALEPTETISRVSWMGAHLADRRGYTDITADPAFAHDKSYHWLVGVLDVSQDAVARLRYASVDDEDVYNGHVILTSAKSLKGFQSGQVVRVEGELASPETADSWAVFRVTNITLVRDH
jgi:hypothetical protein